MKVRILPPEDMLDAELEMPLLGSRTLMMDSGRIVLDVQGEERKNMTVNDLLERFKARVGEDLDNDRILLS